MSEDGLERGGIEQEPAFDVGVRDSQGAGSRVVGQSFLDRMFHLRITLTVSIPTDHQKIRQGLAAALELPSKGAQFLEHLPMPSTSPANLDVYLEGALRRQAHHERL